MKTWIKHNRIPLLFSVVILTLSLLILFQIKWLLTSRDLVEEQFDQKISTILGETLIEHNKRYESDLEWDELSSCNAEKDCFYFEGDSITMAKKGHLENMLSSTMRCYGVSDEYDVTLVSGKNTLEGKTKSYSCSINPTISDDKSAQLYVTFPGRNQYVFDKLKFMIISSVLISFLLALVSFIILRALVQQKRLTENNIDFFNNTAHELKTPLTNISLALNLFNRKNQNHKDEKYLQIMKRETAKLTNQIERVLYLSKMETGEYILKEEEVCLKEVITESVQYMDMIRAEKDGMIDIDFPVSDCIVKGDRFHLSNICINLIDNALKYCDENPHLRISLRHQNGCVKLLFSDNGIGISKYDQEHIFQKFQRVNTGDVRNTKGFGIGLSYVKAALDMHKGFIKVNSEVNKGSQFEISIPLN